MKIKTTFYNHSIGKDYDPLIHVVYPDNRADQLSYVPTAKMVDTMFRTGQMVQASKQFYDFSDGNDDGRAIPLDRMRGLEMPEISQALNENETKLNAHSENIKAMAKEDRRRKSAAKEPPAPKEEGANVVSD